ncbi:uncharacterized protein LOC122511782 [Leptopilina heterotoma]|uniref:uncharacterized protein LOC122511782 n=1 Tax=Leptopilina heterotoma TaxID=63436 RepID=UPI001CA9D8EF|nr:uncharacterized protein LOC122511782 [Leptopilina heterotoma]
MYSLHVLCVLMFVTSVLTSVTKKETKIEHDELDNKNNSTSKTVVETVKNSFEGSKISSEQHSSTEKIDKSNSTVRQFILEGGGKIDLVTSGKFVTPMSEEKKSSPKLIEEVNKENKNSKFSNEQKKSNIKPRKGVGNETLASDEEISLEINKSNGKQNKTAIKTTAATDSVIKLEKSTVKININNTSQHLSTVTEKISTKGTTEKAKKHKLKPTVTIGGINVDKPIPATPTKSPPLGMPRKIDYVVPIMITIFTVPLLSVATYILYRRGRDCWDKRHYRRMDFLIDGMYNE